MIAALKVGRSGFTRLAMLKLAPVARAEGVPDQGHIGLAFDVLTELQHLTRSGELCLPFGIERDIDSALDDLDALWGILDDYEAPCRLCGEDSAGERRSSDPVMAGRYLHTDCLARWTRGDNESQDCRFCGATTRGTANVDDPLDDTRRSHAACVARWEG